MYCPKCGKMYELDEGDFCTGCGAKVDLEILEKTRKKYAGRKNPEKQFIPYGARYVSTDTEMTAMGKGLVIGAFLGFFLFAILARFTFLIYEIPVIIGWAIIGIVPTAFLGLLVVSVISPNAKSSLADSFEFIKTDGVVYHIVDFLVLKLPFLKKK